ncbi:MAG: transposase [Anaerolineae bacterium]|nr:transposase [Anaerolineae bacterium]
MTRYDRNKHHRRSTRLRGYDYAQAGAYFVTIVTHDRETLFDDPVFRRAAETMWQRIPRHSPHVELDKWVVMPNHVHGIIVIVDDSRGRGEAFRDGRSVLSDSFPCAAPFSAKLDPGNASPLPEPKLPSGSLGAIVGNFKSVTTRRINRIRKTPGAPVWQRNYYERIIRNERELNAVRHYISENPARWAEDRENPDRL